MKYLSKALVAASTLGAAIVCLNLQHEKSAAVLLGLYAVQALAQLGEK